MLRLLQKFYIVVPQVHAKCYHQLGRHGIRIEGLVPLERGPFTSRAGFC